MSAFNASFSCGGGGASGPTGTITSLVPPTDNIGEEGNLYIQFGIGGAKNRLYIKQDGVWVQYSGPRSVLTFNGVSQYAVAPRVEEIDLADPNLEFEIEFTGMWGDKETVLSTGDPNILQDDQYKNELKFTNIEGRLHAAIRGRAGWASSIGALPLDGNTHNYSIKVKKLSGVPYCSVTIGVDKEIVSQNYQAQIGELTTPQVYLYIGARLKANTGFAVEFLQGQLRDLRIWTDGDRNTGTLTRDYRMDEGWRGTNNQVLVNYATELGEELVVNGDFSDGLNGWDLGQVNHPDTTVSVSDGRLHYVNESGETDLVNQRLYLDTQKTYLYTYLFDVVSGSIRDTTYGTNVMGQGTYGRTIISKSAVLAEYDRGVGGSLNDFYVDNVSIKQADGYGTYVGLTEASWTEETV